MYIYINQETEEMRRFDSVIEKMLGASRIRVKYKIIVFCNLFMGDMVNEVVELLIKILSVRKLR